MKRGLFFVLVFLLLFSLCVFAAFESVGLRIGESREINGVNFTLLRTNEADEKVVLCMNNQKIIASDTSTFGKAIVKVKDVFSNSAALDIEVACDKTCKCTEDCSNTACFASEPPPLLPCVSDSDCDDNNPCTLDKCNKVIDKCTHEEIENCSIPEEPEQPPEGEPETPTTPSVSPVELFTYVLLGIVILLVTALIVKRVIR
ncbi:MAG: hypothetical protein ABIH63_03995 [archaeon]